MNVTAAIRLIYPNIQGGFMYRQTHSDGTLWENPIDGLVWENKEFEKPTWDQIALYSNIYELHEGKTNKINQLNKNRNDFCLIPIEHKGNTFASTLEAKNAICYKTSSLPDMDSTCNYYTYPEGKKVQLTREDLIALADLIEAREIYSRDKRYDLVNEINDCQSLEELENINIDF